MGLNAFSHRLSYIPTAMLAFTLLLTPANAQEVRQQRLKGVTIKKMGSGPFFLTDIADPKDGTQRLFLTTQKGKIYIYDTKNNTYDRKPFLDISARVVMKYDMGLLSIAFHPDWKNNGKFYCFYSGKGKTAKGHGFVARVSEFQAAGGKQGAAGSERELLVFPSHIACRRGGALVFGKDGMLYIGIGDSAGKRMKGAASGIVAQQKESILGKILRIDVDNKGDKTPYAIPPGNPFKGGGKARSEIWAYGLRNPWRISFDSAGKMWVGDNGEDTREEINIIIKGGNYGWPWREGTIQFPGLTPDEKKNVPNQTFREPIFDYKNLPPRTRAYAIIGGHKYEGTLVEALKGVYVYADHGIKTVFGIRYDIQKQQVTADYLIQKMKVAPTSFCRDAQGELWFVSYAPGGVYKLVKN